MQAGGEKMGAKYGVLGAAIIAAFSTAAFSKVASATACLATTAAVYDSMYITETADLCTTNNRLGSTFIESKPTTTIYNLVDNSVNFLRPNDAASSHSSFIESTPTTVINNLVDNSINVQISGTSEGPIIIFIQSNPTTIIYNTVDNSINFMQVNETADPTIGNLIESTPTTNIYNLADNSVNVQDGPAFIGITATPEPPSLPLLGIGLSALGLVCVRQRKREPGCPIFGPQRHPTSQDAAVLSSTRPSCKRFRHGWGSDLSRLDLG
jgi:hypothetical protein